MRTRDILLVDHDIDSLYLLSILLKLEGLDAIATSHGTSALEIFEKENFRIVISNLNMPEINGLELAAKVRELRSDIPIVLLSESPVTVIAENSAMAGITEILPKPIDMKRLLSIIRTARYKAGSIAARHL